MKNLHIPTIFVTLGLVGLVAILSGQNMVGSPRVTVHNPLGVPGWVPSDVWMARAGIDPATTALTFYDYTVPSGHFALARSLTGRAGVHLYVDEGLGFYEVTQSTGSGGAGGGSNSAFLEPGIFFDEGAVIRAFVTGTTYAPATVHGYLVPK